MYSNIRQWKRVRERVLVKRESLRSVAASEGMSRITVRKMVKHELPPGYQVTTCRKAPVLGNHAVVLQELLAKNAVQPASQRHTERQLFEVLREQGYGGSYSAIRHQMGISNKSRFPAPWQTVQSIVRSLSEIDATRFLSSLFRKPDLENLGDIAQRQPH